jgi:FtsZ-interacting cell division protein ZipA
MSDLQLALLALGAIIIVAVIVFNWWQERSLRKMAADTFEEAERDPLLEDEFHIDTDAVLTDEAQPAATFSPTYDEAMESSNPAIAEAASAVAEFEHDMAASEDIPELTRAYQPEPTDEADPIWQDEEAATMEELRSDAGFVDTIPDAVQPSTFEPQAIVESDPTPEPSIPEAPAETTAPASSAAVADTEHGALPSAVSHQIDISAVLYLAQPVSGLDLRQYLLSLVDLDKPVYAYGRGADGVWRMLTREQEEVVFTRAACSLQLADRGGPVSRATLGRFQNAIEEMGRTFSAQVEWHGNPDPVIYANDLDQFCIEVDKLVGFHLAQGASGPFTGTKFRGMAEASGLTLAEDGAFYYLNESGQPLFALINQDKTPFTLDMLRTAVIRGVTFQLDIPRVKHCTEVFNQMVLIAKQMEGSLSGRLVDDNQRPLGDMQIEKIRQQLKVIHATMVARGIMPGSPGALRLFS